MCVILLLKEGALLCVFPALAVDNPLLARKISQNTGDPGAARYVFAVSLPGSAIIVYYWRPQLLTLEGERRLKRAGFVIM